MANEDPAPLLSPESNQHKQHHLEELSRKAKITLILSTSFFLITSIYYSPTSTLLLPVILAPTALLLAYRLNLPQPQRGILEIILWIYLGTATISTALLIIVQGALAYVAAWLLFREDRDWFLKEFQTVSRESDVRDDAHRVQRAEFAARPSYWVFMLIMTFVLAGLCEEVQKYVSIVLAVRSRKREAKENARGAEVVAGRSEYLIYGATAGLSFATIEMYMFLVAGAAKAKSNGELAKTVAERFVIGMAAHLLCGLSTALGMYRRDIEKAKTGMLQVILRSALCHGAVDFGLMAFCAVKGNVGWLHPEDLVGTLTCYVMSVSGTSLLGWLVWQELKETQKMK